MDSASVCGAAGGWEGWMWMGHILKSRAQAHAPSSWMADRQAGRQAVEATATADPCPLSMAGSSPTPVVSARADHARQAKRL